jgi:hypothetical protein
VKEEERRVGYEVRWEGVGGGGALRVCYYCYCYGTSWHCMAYRQSRSIEFLVPVGGRKAQLFLFFWSLALADPFFFLFCINYTTHTRCVERKHTLAFFPEAFPISTIWQSSLPTYWHLPTFYYQRFQHQHSVCVPNRICKCREEKKSH